MVTSLIVMTLGAAFPPSILLPEYGALAKLQAHQSLKAENVEASACLDDNGNPAIQISWRLDFFRSYRKAKWQIYRDDILLNPVGATDGHVHRFLDTSSNRKVSYYKNTTRSDDLNCEDLTPAETEGPGILLGRPFIYQIRAIYGVDSLEMPLAASGLPKEGETKFCYFLSDKAAAMGSATALRRPKLVSPRTDEVVSGFRDFSFTSVAEAAFPIRVSYVLQISKSKDFRDERVYTSKEVVWNGLRDHSISFSSRFPGDTFTQALDDLAGAKRNDREKKLWWRIGARNIEDEPGPVQDVATGLRYIFSEPRSCLRP